MKQEKTTLLIKLKTEGLGKAKINELILETREQTTKLRDKFNFLIISSDRYNIKLIDDIIFIEINKDTISDFPLSKLKEMDKKFIDLIKTAFDKDPIIIYGIIKNIEK